MLVLAVEAKNRHGVGLRRGSHFRVVSRHGEVARRQKSHGDGGSTSGGFVGWKNEQGFDVCGSVGRFRLTRAENHERKSVPVRFT